MEGYCSTGQSPQWAVVPMEEEEEEEESHQRHDFHKKKLLNLKYVPSLALQFLS
jgi:hypothetical protein